MGAPTVPYKVWSRGYNVSGDVRSGYRASVSYFMLWADAFTFADDIFGKTHAVTVGPITWQLPYKFPVTRAPLYAQRFNIEPMGLDKGGNPITLNKGLSPGEYWTHALVTVEFETPTYIQQVQDDPQGQNQLDPSNPITMCEQSIKIASKTAKHSGGSWVFSDNTPYKGGDIGILVCESRLVLTFPRVPYMPWKLIRPFINKINDVPIMNCDRGTLMLIGMDTKIVQTNEGLGQQLQLEFADNGVGTDWNTLPKNGVPAMVHANGASNTDANRPYKYVDFSAIFYKLEFIPGTSPF
jgi:hypothetical protein